MRCGRGQGGGRSCGPHALSTFSTALSAANVILRTQHFASKLLVVNVSVACSVYEHPSLTGILSVLILMSKVGHVERAMWRSDEIWRYLPFPAGFDFTSPICSSQHPHSPWTETASVTDGKQNPLTACELCKNSARPRPRCFLQLHHHHFPVGIAHAPHMHMQVMVDLTSRD